VFCAVAAESARSNVMTASVIPRRPFSGMTLTTVGPGPATGAGADAAGADVAVWLAVDGGVFVALVVAS
jgi:hypothetical protein